MQNPMLACLRVLGSLILSAVRASYASSSSYLLMRVLVTNVFMELTCPSWSVVSCALKSSISCDSCPCGPPILLHQNGLVFGAICTCDVTIGEDAVVGAILVKHKYLLQLIHKLSCLLKLLSLLQVIAAVIGGSMVVLIGEYIGGAK
jgi:hypothetical protein